MCAVLLHTRSWGPHARLSSHLPKRVLKHAPLSPLCPNTVTVSRHRAKELHCQNTPHVIPMTA